MSMEVFYKFSFQDLRTSVYSGIGHSFLSLVNLPDSLVPFQRGHSSTKVN